jgi:chromosome segregation ATPase
MLFQSMEEMMDILNSARNILVSVDEEYERVVRQYEYLLDKKNRTEEECNRVAEQLQSLTELEEHWFSDKLWSEEPISITGSYRGKEDKW